MAFYYLQDAIYTCVYVVHVWSLWSLVLKPTPFRLSSLYLPHGLPRAVLLVNMTAMASDWLAPFAFSSIQLLSLFLRNFRGSKYTYWYSVFSTKFMFIGHSHKRNNNIMHHDDLKACESWAMGVIWPRPWDIGDWIGFRTITDNMIHLWSWNTTHLLLGSQGCALLVLGSKSQRSRPWSIGDWKFISGRARLCHIGQGFLEFSLILLNSERKLNMWLSDITL